MADAYVDAVAAARDRLEASLLEMSGARAQTITAIGTALSRGETDEAVVRELALASAYMAADEHAFFDAASLFAEQVRERIRAALRACAELSDGPNSLLRWTLSSRIPRDRISEIDELIEQIRRARFAQNNLTEVVRDDLIAAAAAAADKLVLLLSREEAADLPSLSELELLIELGLGCVGLVAQFQSLKAAFSSQRFTDIALLRVLESAEATLSSLSGRVSEGERDIEAESESLATITALESATELLLAGITPFGTLLLPSADTTPQNANLSGTVRLVPVPERARGGQVLSAQISEHPTDASLRRATLPAPGAWNDSTSVEQALEVAHYENLWALGAFTPQPKLLDRGTGTIAGDPYYPDVIVPDPSGTGALLAGIAEIERFVSVADLGSRAPVAAYADKYAYVEGAPTGAYYCDGLTWTLVVPDADFRRNRFLLADAFPLGDKYPTDSIRVYSGAAGLDLSVASVAAGPQVSTPGSYEARFGVLLDQHVSNSELSVSWEVRVASATTTNRLLTAYTGTWLQNAPAAELLGQVVTVLQDDTWTHRYVTEVVESGDRVEIVLDEDVQFGSAAYLFLPTIRGLNYPRSPFVIARPTGTNDVLDVLPGDVIAAEVDGKTELRPVLHCAGDLVLLAAPLHTHPAFASEAPTLRSGTTGKASLSQASPFAYVPARRFRGVSVGDKIVPLAPPDATPVGETTPLSGEAYSVRALGAGGIDVSPSSESTDPLPRTYGRTVVWPATDFSTDLFAVQTPDGEDKGISDLERTARRLKGADDPTTQLDDVWPVRSVSFFVAGSPVDAERVGENMVRLARTFPVYGAPIPAELRARLEEESRRGDLVAPAPGTDVSLSGAYHYPLGGDRRFLLSSGTLPSGTTDASVLYEYALTGPLSGPIAVGGAREFGWWAWVSYRLQQLLSSPPDFEELREDLGRAYADLGATTFATYTATFVEEVSADAKQVRVQFTDLPPNAAILAGTDFTFASSSTALPVRVVSPGPDGDTSAEDLLSTQEQAILTLTDRVILSPGDAVSLRVTTVSQAWVEFRTLVTFLDSLYATLGNLVPPEERVLAATASRLDAAGFPKAADAVRGAQFSKWSATAELSLRADLADTLNTLVSSLLSRRSSPLSG